MTGHRKTTKRNAWLWVPSLYFAEGIPYVLVMTLSVIFYKRMGVSNSDIALYTSWLYLPWVIKPLWSPIVDIFKTKRFWIVIMQLLIGAGLAGVAFTIPVPNFFQYTLAFFWLLAFSSATHDIAADGFYMLGLSKHDQAFFVGIRSTFYRFAMLTGQGLLVILAGHFEARTGLPPVEVEVIAVEESSRLPDFYPSETTTHTYEDSLYFIYKAEVTVGLGKQDRDSVSNILAEIEKWNIAKGFYEPEEDIATASAGDSWWRRTITVPIEKGLRKWFNPRIAEPDELMTGNIGWTWFHLNRPPGEGETIVLNFTYERGDKSISLHKSYRYEFTDKNWNIPAIAAFKLDPGLDEKATAFFSGLSGNIPFAWTFVFAVIAGIFLLFFLYHRFMLPRPADDKPTITEGRGILREFFETFATFFRKKEIVVILIFLLVYRLGESQLVKLASPFLLDSREMNGLGLTTGDLGLIYGTIGMLALSLGGIIGGIAASRKGLKYWIWWMVAAMNLPNLVYVFLSYAMPSSLWVVGASVAVEQFGYGFGFTAYMLYMIYVSEGKHKTAHFAITTGFMALGMMIPGMLSGWLQEIVGYRSFFVWVMICTIPSFLVIPFIKIDPAFGRKNNEIKN
jgi:PAT family beta-lactamase induction signal transducer AmpG